MALKNSTMISELMMANQWIFPSSTLRYGSQRDAHFKSVTSKLYS
jgi:hypothetical protein